MTPKSDATAPSGTLPTPELNPLLNPILNKNLGRWAEVYFTTPPERRDEAVLHLLRELESEPETTENRPRRPAQIRVESPASLPHSRVTSVAICPTCGFDNEAPQKFCGDCGALLDAPVKKPNPEPPLSPAAQPSKSSETAVRFVAGESRDPAPQFGSILGLSEPARLTSDQHYPETASVADLSSDEPESSALKLPYRLAIAAMLTVIVAGLAYYAWRNNQVVSERSPLPAQAPPVETQPSTARPTAVSAPPTGPAALATTANPAPASPPTATTDEERPEETAKLAPASSVEATPASKSAAIPANGGQELATAVTFLNGQPRDSAQAAQWLWKAVEKQNTAADVLLAGLYLRGDGVQKNCDQGRILLDAAADKGSKDAASLLRNLSAFGCE